MNHTLIIMAGPSGVGKSVMANVIADSHDDCVIISRDKIRFSLLQEGEDYFAHEDDVVRNYYDALNSMLQTHEYVIADATHATKKARRQLFANVNTKNVRVVGVWIEVPLEVALKQNAARSGRARVDDEVVKRMYRYKVSPQKEEGFNEVIFISGHTDQAASDSAPFVSNIFDKLQAI
jgi:predicted kinase